MFINQFVLALAVTGLLLLGLFALGRRASFPGFVGVFALLFLFVWAGGIWVGPQGPAWLGVSWLTFLFLGVFMTVLILAAAPRRRHGSADDPADKEGDPLSKAHPGIVLGGFYWLALMLLGVAILVHYVVT